MVYLEDQEKLALNEFLKTLEGQRFDPKSTVLRDRIHRGDDGQIIVPVPVNGPASSFSLSHLMGHKISSISTPPVEWFLLKRPKRIPTIRRTSRTK